MVLRLETRNNLKGFGLNYSPEGGKGNESKEWSQASKQIKILITKPRKLGERVYRTLNSRIKI